MTARLEYGHEGAGDPPEVDGSAGRNLRAKSGLSDPGQPADTDTIRRRLKDDPSP